MNYNRFQRQENTVSREHYVAAAVKCVNGRKGILIRLVKWSILILPVLGAFFLTGCRLFTIGD